MLPLLQSAAFLLPILSLPAAFSQSVSFRLHFRRRSLHQQEHRVQFCTRSFSDKKSDTWGRSFCRRLSGNSVTPFASSYCGYFGSLFRQNLSSRSTQHCSQGNNHRATRNSPSALQDHSRNGTAPGNLIPQHLPVSQLRNNARICRSDFGPCAFAQNTVEIDCNHSAWCVSVFFKILIPCHAWPVASHLPLLLLLLSSPREGSKGLHCFLLRRNTKQFIRRYRESVGKSHHIGILDNLSAVKHSA